MRYELLDMQKDTFKRVLIVTGIGGLLAVLVYGISQQGFQAIGGLFWVGLVLLNIIMYWLASRRFNLAVWSWTIALIVLIAAAIPWSAGGAGLGPLPYAFILVTIMSSMLISRNAPWYVAAAASAVSLVLLILTRNTDAAGWGAILPPLTMLWITAALSWLASDQLVTALEWTQKARQETDARAEELRQSRDALEKSLRIRDTLNIQLQEAHQQAERRAAQFEAMAEVSRHITSLLDLEQLLMEVVSLICSKFNYYYAGVFLVDEQNQMLTLRAAAGQQGTALLQRGLRLPRDETSLNGRVAMTGQLERISDVSDSPYTPGEGLLDETASALVIPLFIGQQVVGTLDVQSTQRNAFSQDDVVVLQGLADQIAVAIQNTRSFQQAQAALKELEMTNRLLTREGWRDYLLGQPAAARRVEFGAAGASEAGSRAAPLVIPLELRGQPMGQLTLRRGDDRPWTAEEIEIAKTIALQTALAADNARLIEQTQRALEGTRALYEASREITAASDMQQVFSAVLNNLARTGIHAAAIVLFNAPTRQQATHLELAQVWDHLNTPRLAPGVRFAIADFPLFDRITAEAALTSSDLLADPQVDESAKMLLGGLGFQAMAIIPLMTRGQWIGMVFIMMEQPHTFTSAEINFYRALADQAAVAIDSRRLLAETQRAAQREALIREITTRIRAAGDIQDILETTAAELARTIGVSRAIVRLAVGDREEAA